MITIITMAAKIDMALIRGIREMKYFFDARNKEGDIRYTTS